MKIYIKNVENLTIPKKGSDLAAGYDIVATSDPKIVGERIGSSWTWTFVDFIEYETNLYIAPSVVTYHTLIYPRSSISKYNLLLVNSLGLIDADYRGHCLCRFRYIWQPCDLEIDTDGRRMYGNVNYNKIYKKGDKIAQLVFEPTTQVEFEVVDELTETKRAGGGFGSSGV